MAFKKWLAVDAMDVVELHEILCAVPFEITSANDTEPSTKRHRAIESMIEQLERMM